MNIQTLLKQLRTTCNGLRKTLQTYGVSKETEDTFIRYLIGELSETKNESLLTMVSELSTKNVLDKSNTITAKFKQDLQVLIDFPLETEKKPKKKAIKMGIFKSPAEFIKHAIFKEIYNPTLKIPPADPMYRGDGRNYYVNGLDSEAAEKLNALIAENCSCEDLTECDFTKNYILVARYYYMNSQKTKSSPMGFSKYVRQDNHSLVAEQLERLLASQKKNPGNPLGGGFDKSL
jgi:hypothetical protein